MEAGFCIVIIINKRLAALMEVLKLDRYGFHSRVIKLLSLWIIRFSPQFDPRDHTSSSPALSGILDMIDFVEMEL